MQTGGGTLSAPAITLDGNVVKWQAVENATSYSVKVGSDAPVSVTATSYTINKTTAGSYKITVTAKSSDDKWLESAPSNEVTYVVSGTGDKTALTAPVITLNGKTVSWSAVQNAASYDVKVNDATPVNVTATSYKLPQTAVGSYKVTVVAKAAANSELYKDSVASNEVTYVIDQEIQVTLTEIDVDNKGVPSKIYLDQGITELDFSQIVVTAYYDNESEKEIALTDVVIGSYDLTTVGNKEIVISYTENGVTETYVLRVAVEERGIDDIDEYDTLLLEYSSAGTYTIDATSIRNMKGENMLVGGTVTLPQGKTLLSVDDKFVVVTVAKLVGSVEQFKAIADDMNGYYVLTNDINFGDDGWHVGAYIGAAPMKNDGANVLDITGVGDAEEGREGVAFNGTIDGQGYALKNMKISAGTEQYWRIDAYGLAIFGYVGEEGAIRNLTLRNIDIRAGKYTAFLVAYNQGTIENICIEESCYMYTAYRGGYAAAAYNDGTVNNVVCYVSNYVCSNADWSTDMEIANNTSIGDDKGGISGSSTNGYIANKTDMTATLGAGWKYFEDLGTVLANDKYILARNVKDTLCVGERWYLRLALGSDTLEPNFAFYGITNGEGNNEIIVFGWDAEVGSHYIEFANTSTAAEIIGKEITMAVYSTGWKTSVTYVFTVAAAKVTGYENDTETLNVIENTDIDLTTINITEKYTDGSTQTIHPTKVEDFDKAGTVGVAQTVKAFYGEGEDDYVEITVTLIAKSVESIEIDATSAYKSVYTVGDELDLTGLKIVVTYNNDTNESIAVTSAMLSTYDMSTAGGKEITITHGGKTCVLNITVQEENVTVTSIAIVGNIVKTTYKLNDEVVAADLVGATITATNSNGTTTSNIAITLAMISYNFNTVGTAQITVTYEGKTATIDVTVVDYATALNVTAANTTLTYNATTTLDLVANATYTLTMASGATQPVTTGVTASEYKAGLNTITYTYTDEYATVTATKDYEIWYEVAGTAAEEWAVMQGNLAGYYRLTKDLDFGDAAITSLGKQPVKGGDETTCNVDNPFDDGLVQKGVPFTGKFDGDGYTIRYFKIEGSNFGGDGFGLSLFGYIGATGEVKNFTVKNASVKSKNQTGFIATVNEGLVENIVIDSSCSIMANWLTAGVVVYNKGEAIVRNVVCYVATAVKEDNETRGNLAVIQTNYATAQNCYAISSENFLTDSAALADVEGWAFIEEYGPVYGKYVIAMPELTAPQGGKATFRIYHSETFLLDYINIWGVSTPATYPTRISDTDGVYVGTFDLKDDMTAGQSYTVGLRVNGKYVTYKLTVTPPAQEGL